jgi:hypothetical protein
MHQTTVREELGSFSQLQNSMVKLFSAIAFVTICFAPEAVAQVYVPPPITVPAPTDLSNILITREIGRIEAERAGSGSQISNSGLATQMPSIYGPFLANMSRVRIVQPTDKLGSAAGGDTSFHSSQPPFVPQQLAARLGKTEQERQYIEAVLSKCLNYYLDSARRQGVPLNDVTRALNYFISTNYYIYSLGAGPTPEQMKATREVIRANMARSDLFLRMSDKQKQEAYETLIVLASFTDYGFGTSKESGDTKAAAQFREMAKYNLETLLGAPIERIHFTNNGLTLK